MSTWKLIGIALLIAVLVCGVNDVILVAGLRGESFGSATIHIYQEWFPVGLTCGSVGLTGQAAQNGLPCIDKYGDWTGYTAPGATTAASQVSQGTIAPYQTLLQFEATTTYPASAAITLGPYVGATSTTSTVLTVPNGGFKAGDPCIVGFNNVPTSTQFGMDAVITSSTATTATATVTLWNGGGGAGVTLNTTSSEDGTSSTLRVVCSHYN